MLVTCILKYGLYEKSDSIVNLVRRVIEQMINLTSYSVDSEYYTHRLALATLSNIFLGKNDNVSIFIT